MIRPRPVERKWYPPAEWRQSESDLSVGDQKVLMIRPWPMERKEYTDDFHALRAGDRGNVVCL